MCGSTSRVGRAYDPAMQQPATSAKTAERFQDVGEQMAGLGVSIGKMFGMPCLKAKGKSFAGLWGDAMVFKLSGDALTSALTLNGAALFDPMGGRPMKEWVVVPAAHAMRWRELAGASLVYVAG
jgi:hypothetical protein